MQLPLQKKLMQFVSDVLTGHISKRVIGIQTNSKFNMFDSYSSKIGHLENIPFEKILSSKPTGTKLKIAGGFKINLSNLMQTFFPSVPGGKFATVIDILNATSPELTFNLEKEFTPLIRLLRPRRKPHSNYIKIKKVVVVDNFFSLTGDEQTMLNLIIDCVQSKKINDTLIIIQYLDIDSYQLEDAHVQIYSQTFDISEEDLRAVTEKEINFSPHVVTLAQSLGIEFFKKYTDIIILSNQTAQDNIDVLTKKIVDKMLSTTIQDRGIDTNKMEHFLYQCSMFLRNFTKFDIEDALDPSMISFIAPAIDAKLLGRNPEDNYHFLEESIRTFFYRKAKESLQSSVIEKIFNYLNTSYPREYFYLAELKQQFSRNNEEIISFYIVAYYFAKKEGKEDERMRIVSKMKKNELGNDFVSNLEKIRKHNKFQSAEFNEQMDLFFQQVLDSQLTELAKLCCYSVLMGYYFENSGTSATLIALYDNLASDNLNPENCNDLSYWENEFAVNRVLLAYSFEDPPQRIETSRSRVSQKLIAEVSKAYTHSTTKKNSNYLKLLRCANTIFVEDTNKSLEYTKKAYNISKKFPYEYELSKINYSYSLIYVGQYIDAANVLIEKSTFDLNIINPDTYFSYQNNLIVSLKLAGKITTKKALNKFKTLINEVDNLNSSDVIILRNNLAALQLEQDSQNALTTLITIKEGNDQYHSFYALHNILYIYFRNNSLDQFKQFYKGNLDDIFPNLLKPYKRFFVDKFNYMHWLLEQESSLTEREKKLTEQLNNHYPEKTFAHFKQMILFGGIERWFE